MATPNWYLDELRHAGPEHLDTSYVTGYERKAGTDPGADLALLYKLGLHSTHTLVDLGAGTGVFALAAAPYCCRVIAVDVSPPMLDALRMKAEEMGLQNIECIRAGFLTYAHHGDPADFVYTRNALHHLPDFWKALALRRIAAMLKIGGVLRIRDLVYSFTPDESNHIIESWLAGAVDDPAHGWTSEEYATHLREEYSTFNWLLEPMLDRAGFSIRDAQHHESRIYSAYTCIRVR